MCGITGVVNLTSQSNVTNCIRKATSRLANRGPDSEGIFEGNGIALGHRRLSIIDTTEGANQPMKDPTGRFVIVFNGEIYNYKTYRALLEAEGVTFKTGSDTEVLLHLYIREREKCLDKLNGFFAFCVFDQQENSLFIARDRAGIKPLVYTLQDGFFAFASELKALFEYPIDKEIDKISLFTYLQLNYIPAPNSILEKVYKLLPGHYIKIDNCYQITSETISPVCYYQIPKPNFTHQDLNPNSYSAAQNNLMELLKESVQKRMISDVPLGSFLSGGIDSSVICALASRYTDKLHTFSIGFSDEPFFDETEYALEVAKKFKTEHTVFKLSNQDLYEHLFDVLDYIDEPFADSSALNVYILSKRTKEHVTVALSGDGADELFSGYNKHAAEYRARNVGSQRKLIQTVAPFFKKLPQNRDGKLGNLNRQLQRFAEGMKLSHKERYWQWATFRNEETANYLLQESKQYSEQRLTDDAFSYKKRKDRILSNITKTGTLNEVLYTDMQLVLPNDMLFKVDHMSMANGLEVRTPFLDQNVLNFAFEIPVQFKINQNIRKKIVQDTFRTILPEKLYRRPKKGFEIPLTSWLKNELIDVIKNDLLSKDFILEQNIFNWPAVERQINKLESNNVGNASGTIWALVVFQYWYKKYILN